MNNREPAQQNPIRVLILSNRLKEYRLTLSAVYEYNNYQQLFVCKVQNRSQEGLEDSQRISNSQRGFYEILPKSKKQACKALEVQQICDSKDVPGQSEFISFYFSFLYRSFLVQNFLGGTNKVMKYNVGRGSRVQYIELAKILLGILSLSRLGFYVAIIKCFLLT